MIPNSPVSIEPMPRVHPAVFAAGIVALCVATGASLYLVIQHLPGVTLPGCGAGSPCAALGASKWGKVPGLDWPVSFLGTAFFGSLLGAWIAGRGERPAWFRLVSIAGALGSAAFIGIMLGMGEARPATFDGSRGVMNTLCPFCLAAHLANFCFLAISALAPKPEAGVDARPFRAPAAAVMTFVVVSAALGVVETQTRAMDNKKAEAENAALVKGLQSKPAAPTGPAVPVKAPTSNAMPMAAPSGPVAPPTTAPGAPMPPMQRLASPPPLPPSGVFTGRWRFGPEVAPVRVVMFTDYQCPDCRQIEAQVETLLTKYPDVSVSIRHFPFCTQCNLELAPEANFHPNACWAARAAEAAGMMYGMEGFKRMHFWLFKRAGGFTDVEFDQGLQELGFAQDHDLFIQTMTGPETLARVQGDIDDANIYGLRTTPFIFINGAELRAWQSPNALVNAVDALMAGKPAPAGPEADHPMRGPDQAVVDWRNEVQKGWPDPKLNYAMGTMQLMQAPVRVTVFGDPLEPNCAEVDRIIRDTIMGDPQVAYEFRYYPFDRDCNQYIPNTKFPGSCHAVHAELAAGLLGGKDAFWAMHLWITQNQKMLNDLGAQGASQKQFDQIDAACKAQAVKIGLNGDAFTAKLNAPEINDMLAMETSIGMRMGIQSIPVIYVNGKLLARWKFKNGFVIERVIDEAHKQKAAPAPPPPNPNAIPQIPGINAPIGR